MLVINITRHRLRNVLLFRIRPSSRIPGTVELQRSHFSMACASAALIKSARSNTPLFLLGSGTSIRFPNDEPA